MHFSLLVVLGLLTGPVFVYGQRDHELCESDPEYATIPASICLTDSPNYIVDSGVVRRADKTLIVDLHNQYRSEVTNPTAKNMLKMVWNADLAYFAQKYAQQCKFEHDSFEERKLRSNFNQYAGQNIAIIVGLAPEWGRAIDLWHREGLDFTYGDQIDSNGDQNGNVVGHYTQVVYGDAAKVGCGYALCDIDSEYWEYLICNYILGNGMGAGSLPYPYESGTCDADCGSHCVDNLCDCGGKFCYNYGILNKADCTCSCSSLFSGAECLTPVCGGKECENGGTLDVTACTCACTPAYTGDNCETKDCTGVVQTSWCGTSWPPSYCEIFGNVPDDCPIMCGVCP